jgi:hypothetical protein
MTNTNPRDLIKRLADELDHYRQLLMGDGRETHALATEAYAYLDQPEPEEEEWYSRFGDWLEREMPEGTVIGDPLWWASKIADYLARAYLAQPEPEGPTAAELSNLWRACSSPSVFARAVLARWGRPVFRQKELTDEQLLKCFKIATPCYNMEEWRRELDGMRAAIAADRALCARLAVEPVPESPTDEEIDQLSHETWKLRKSTQWAIRTALARWGSQPSTANHSANPTH